MNKQNILPVILSVAALLLLTACLCAAFTYAVFQIKNKNSASDAPGPSENTGDVTPSADEPSPGGYTTPSPTPGGNDETPSGGEDPTPAEQPWMLKTTPDGGQAYIDRLTFFGDSTTYGMISAKVLKDKEKTTQVWYGPSGTLTLPGAFTHVINDGTYAKGKQLSAIAADKQPQILVITLGVGVSPTITEENFKSSYIKTVDTVLQSSPDTKIICNSIYPVCAVRSSSYENLNNADIMKCNGWLREVVAALYAQGKAVYYLDTYSVLVGNDGYLPVMYSNGDGLHLSASAFNAVLGTLRTHVIPE